MRPLLYGTVALVALAGCADLPTEPRPSRDLAEQHAASPAATLHSGSSSGRVVAMATGSGHRVRNGRPFVFSFHAVQKADGSAEGSYYLDFQDLGPALDNQRLQVTVDVTCMSVSGNRAWVAGIITKVDGPLALEGTVSYFYVTDNGEGAGAVDEVSATRLNDQAGEDRLFCDEQPALLGSVPIERGNAQVKGCP